MVFCFVAAVAALLGEAGFCAAMDEPICGKNVSPAMSMDSGRMIPQPLLKAKLYTVTSPLLHANPRESIPAAALQRDVLDRCMCDTTIQTLAKTWRTARRPVH